MMTNPLITRLRRLTGLTEEDLNALEQACPAVQRFVAGTDIAPQGERPGSFHIVVEGWAARYKILPDGRRQFPALFLPGDICDLDGLLLQRIHSGVCALTACRVHLLPHAQFRDLAEQSPAIRDAFWWLQSVENAISAEWSVGLGRRSANEKVAHLLCELLVRLGTVGLSTERGFAFPLTQGEIADALGLSMVHVNRTLMELRGRGLIETRDRWLTILDVEALKAAAGFEAAYLHLDGPRLAAGASHPAAAERARPAEQHAAPQARDPST